MTKYNAILFWTWFVLAAVDLLFLGISLGMGEGWKAVGARLLLEYKRRLETVCQFCYRKGCRGDCLRNAYFDGCELVVPHREQEKPRILPAEEPKLSIWARAHLKAYNLLRRVL